MTVTGPTITGRPTDAFHGYLNEKSGHSLHKDLFSGATLQSSEANGTSSSSFNSTIVSGNDSVSDNENNTAKNREIHETTEDSFNHLYKYINEITNSTFEKGEMGSMENLANDGSSQSQSGTGQTNSYGLIREVRLLKKLIMKMVPGKSGYEMSEKLRQLLIKVKGMKEFRYNNRFVKILQILVKVTSSQHGQESKDKMLALLTQYEQRLIKEQKSKNNLGGVKEISVPGGPGKETNMTTQKGINNTEEGKQVQAKLLSPINFFPESCKEPRRDGEL